MDTLSRVSYWVTDNLLMPIPLLLALVIVVIVAWVVWGALSVTWITVAMVWNTGQTMSGGVVLLIGVALAIIAGTVGARREIRNTESANPRLWWAITIVILIAAVGLAIFLRRT